ncbi:MAG: esterase-like activity of phytase family protein [Pseudomonadota bacterium]
MLRYLVALILFPTVLLAQAEYLGSFTWERSEDRHGGYSGLEVLEQGRRFVAIADNGQLVQGQIMRNDTGITALKVPYIGGLHSPEGKFVGTIPKRGEIVGADSEGLSFMPDGRMVVSFESDTRVWIYETPEGPASVLPKHPDFAEMPLNGALEAVAVSPAGAILAFRETDVEGRMQGYVFSKGAWDQAFSVEQKRGYSVTGADFGPDGRLYLLERLFVFPLGFASRVRSFELNGNDISDERVEFQSRLGRHDNLEGLSVWRDDTGVIRLTMISDDNYNPLQKTEMVEYRLTGSAGAE